MCGVSRVNQKLEADACPNLINFDDYLLSPKEPSKEL